MFILVLTSRCGRTEPSLCSVPLGSVVSTLSEPLNPLWSTEKYRRPGPTLRDLAPVAGAEAGEFFKCFLSHCVNHAEILVQGLLVAPAPASHCSFLVSYLKGPQHTQVRTDGLDLRIWLAEWKASFYSVDCECAHIGPYMEWEFLEPAMHVLHCLPLYRHPIRTREAFRGHLSKPPFADEETPVWRRYCVNVIQLVRRWESNAAARSSRETWLASQMGLGSYPALPFTGCVTLGSRFPSLSCYSHLGRGKDVYLSYRVVVRIHWEGRARGPGLFLPFPMSP